MSSLRQKLKVLPLLTLALVMMANIPVSAAAKTFSNFTFTTIPNSESYLSVTSKSKADNDQNWYLTITQQSGLGSTSVQNRAFAVSAKSGANLTAMAPIGLYSNRVNTTMHETYNVGTYTTNTYCTLYVSGNNNSAGQYTISISGRYTS